MPQRTEGRRKDDASHGQKCVNNIYFATSCAIRLHPWKHSTFAEKRNKLTFSLLQYDIKT